MIRYRKTIQIKTSRNGEMSIETDLGQTWRTLELNGSHALTDWIHQSAQGSLQHWQKDMSKVVLDAFVHEIQDHHNYKVYKVYQKGHGYQSTASDVFMMRIPQHAVWCIFTSEHTWIFEETLDNFPLTVEDAEGSILKETVRQSLYDWSDTMRGIKPKKIIYNDEHYAAKGIL